MGRLSRFSLFLKLISTIDRSKKKRPSNKELRHSKKERVNRLVMAPKKQNAIRIKLMTMTKRETRRGKSCPQAACLISEVVREALI